MSLQDVLSKIATGNLSSPEFGQRKDVLIGNLYALGGQIQTMLDAIAADPRNFQIEFRNDASFAGFGPDSGTGLYTYSVFIDFDWVESALIYVASDGVAQAFSAEAMLAHELAHLC